MVAQPSQINNLDELRGFVNQVLCDHNGLVPDAFPLTERLLVRSGKPCGIFFCLHGPRAVKLTAIWENQRNTILYYDSSGERFHKTQLTDMPRVATLTACNEGLPREAAHTGN